MILLRNDDLVSIYITSKFFLKCNYFSYSDAYVDE